MFLEELRVDGQSTASEIVQRDYRTADVFIKYDIEYCCGGRWPLTTVCLMKGIEEQLLIEDLKKAARTIYVSPALPFKNWSVDFLVDYIIHVHHHYLQKTLPQLWALLIDFVSDHSKKYPYLDTLQSQFDQFRGECFLHLKHEEEVIFPYLRHVEHAYRNKDAFAAQLVRALRKPINKIAEEDEDVFAGNIYKFRELTGNYLPPERACVNHKVILLKLKELDNDLVQHIHLENEILFPRILDMEKEILKQ